MTSTYLVVDVVVGVPTTCQHWDLHVSQLLGAWPVLTEVSPASSNTGVAIDRGHAGVGGQTDLLHAPVDIERPVESGQGNVVSQVEIVVAGVEEHLLQVSLLLPWTLALSANHPSTDVVEISSLVTINTVGRRHDPVRADDGASTGWSIEGVVFIDSHLKEYERLLDMN